MAKTFHRQIGRFGNRSADDASVAMLIKEVNDVDLLLGKLAEHTKSWRASWTDILINETRLADSFHDVYRTIPRPGDSSTSPEEAPREVMRRVALLHTCHNDLKSDMMLEVEKIDQLLLGPFSEIRDRLKPVKKAIERRDHKKLDFERYNKLVENARKKESKSDRELSVQARNEIDLEKATIAYDQADNHIKDYIPPIVAKVVEFLPLVVEILVQIQFTLLQHSYSALYQYGNDHGYTDAEADVVISEWESFFQPIQHQVETGLKIVAQGKAITKPMNSIPEEKSLRSRLPSLPNIPGRGKKAPPPPPPGSATSIKLEDRERPSVRSQRSSTSIHGKFSRNESSPPPMPRVHPPIGGIKGRSASFQDAERDESPPPPLPGPRPVEASSRPSPSRSYTNGSTIATPLAGLKPGMLRSTGSIPTQSSLRATPRGQQQQQQNDDAPPPYVASRSDLITVVAGKKKPPPPPPKKKFSSKPKEDWVRAIFPYQGQPGEGDLSFNEGDRILVIKRTDSMDDWWEGEVGGRRGQFPANYCESI